jgi:predicted transcriptional regulator
MNNQSEIIIYQTEDGQTKIDVRIENETVWLSLDKMAELFQRDKSTVSRHIRNVFEEGELEQNSVVAKFATTAADGKRHIVTYYNIEESNETGNADKTCTDRTDGYSVIKHRIQPERYVQWGLK